MIVKAEQIGCAVEVMDGAAKEEESMTELSVVRAVEDRDAPSQRPKGFWHVLASQ